MFLQLHLRVNCDFLAFGCELDRVLDQIDEDLLNAQGVGLDDELARKGRVINFDVFLDGLVRQNLDSIRDDPVDRGMFKLEGKNLVLDHVIVEQ